MRIVTAVLAASFLVSALPAYADGCIPSPVQTLIDLPLPDKQANHVMVTRAIRVDKGLEQVFSWFEKVPLENIMTKSESIAAVQETYMLKGSNYASTGSRRMVCLTDGYGAIEQLTENTKNKRFAYTVWNYTLPDATPIAYGDGEFLFDSNEGGTEITWNYRFALKEDHFPGNLGAFGRWLFLKQFADSDWAEYMEQTLGNIKRQVELVGQ